MNRTHKRILSLLLCIAMLATLLPMAVSAADCTLEAHDYQNGFCTDCGDLGPAPLADDVYQISNAGQLYWFAQQVAAGETDLDAVLTQDITINTDLTAEELRPWTPIGSDEDTAYRGTFDGQGHTISGLYIDDSALSYVGLFGFVSGAQIQDLTILESYLSGGDYVGAIAGAGDYATIQGCTSYAPVYGSSNVGGICGNSYMGQIRDCLNYGAVNGSSYVGGILGTGVGYDLERCGNEGSISGNGSRVGGISGKSGGSATIRDCYSTGTVSGNDYVSGILGDQSADTTVTTCYTSGSIVGKGASVGAIAGAMVSGESVIDHCFYLTGSVRATDTAEGVEETRFASGEICYLLNGSTHEGALTWFQTIGTQTTPRLTGAVVYATAPCLSYTNDPEALDKPHTGTAATCTENAVCDVCGETYQGALGHSYESVVTAPTCDADGYTTHTCTVCGDSFVDSPVSALGHSWLDATCTEASTCAVCGATDGEALGHSYDAVIQGPTCTEDGHGAYTCTVCGHSYEEVLPTPGHAWEEANCVAPKTCTVCGLTEGEISDHYYEAVVTDPTCTADGYTTHTCTGCGDSYVDTPVAATGHSWRVATCSSPKTCAICGKTEGEVLGHDYDAVTTAPTCTENGYTTYTCADCGHTYTGNYTDALGHSYEAIVTAPTCTDRGYTTHTCTVCGYSYEDSHVGALGHDYQGGICTNCGDIQLTAPEILSCYSKLQTSVKVTWTPVPNADGYELWRSTTPDDYTSWTRVKTVTDGTTDRYTNQGLTVGVTYYYAVRAFITLEDGSRVYSDYSNMDFMPAAVVFDGPYSNATFRIRLRWQQVGGSHGYQIWRQNEDGSWAIVKTLGDKGNELTDDQGSTTAYSNTDLTSGGTYTYKMRAFTITADGRKVFGSYSDEITVAVMPDTPKITGSSPKTTRAQLSWDAVNGAAGYQIWMSESPDSDFKIVKSITDSSTSYTKYDLESGKTYYFKIRAYVEVDGKKTFGAFTQVIAITVK